MNGANLTLSSAAGMKATFSELGASVLSLVLPDGTEICRSPGPVMGRFANRISNARLNRGGKSYSLPANEGTSCLHGGRKGFDKRNWEVETTGSRRVRFTRLSPDGEEGFPGNLLVSTTYELTDQNELKISYEASTDRETVINLTNHAYFNLGGPEATDILDHELTIHAEAVLATGPDRVPTGEILTITGGPLDFRRPTVIGSRIRELSAGYEDGYDHCYALKPAPVGAIQLVAELRDPRSRRRLRVLTDQPGLQLYTGNHLGNSSLCLETQHFPDSPHHPRFPSTRLLPGEAFKSTTIYQFFIGHLNSEGFHA